MKARYVHFAVLLGLLSLGRSAGLLGQERQRPPFKLDQLVDLVESGVFPDERIVFLANQSCLGFRLDEAAQERLREAGATDRLIASLRGVCIKMLTTVVVRPAEVQLEVGASRILRAEALDQDSARIPNVIFTWSSADTTVAEVSSGGVVLGLAPGEARVTATIEGGPTGSARVRVVRAAAVTEEDSAAFALEGGKGVGTAAALGVVIPGGGEFYAGNPVKGAVVMAGAAAALAAGLLITNQDTLDVTRSAELADCDTPNRCVYPVTSQFRVKETNNLVIGAAVAGVFWLYGLVDGIRSAKHYRPEQPALEEGGGPDASLELLPRDGVVYKANGDLDITLLRVRL